MKSKKILLSALLTLGLAGTASAQGTTVLSQTKNYIPTGIPILLIAPDARAAGMGDAGVASTPDIYSAHWNNAKFAFIEGDFGFSTTYTPWLRNLGVGDMNLLYLGGYKRINSMSAVAASLTYFSLGEIQTTDFDGNSTGIMNPNEFTIDASYALKINEELSLGASARFIRSDLTNGQIISAGDGSHVTTKPATSVAADLGVYWEKPLASNQELALGLFISNLGAKLSYSDNDAEKDFLPANLRFGGRYTYEIDASNKVSAMIDINKLLVPTPPKTLGDSTYSDYYSSYYADYKRTGVMKGVFQSFYDAPGGFAEELHEMQLSVGAEYWYKNTLAARAGYFFEHETKGGRQYATVGIGLKYNIYEFDFAYLIPTTSFSSNPLANTVRISLTINFGKKRG